VNEADDVLWKKGRGMEQMMISFGRSWKKTLLLVWKFWHWLV